MSYYLLPRTPYYTYKTIGFESTSENPSVFISHSLSHYLCGIKERITSKEKQWNTFKKYTNPCEYIHTVIPFKKKSVSKHKPLSRSYFKMIEIINIFYIQFSKPIHTFHLAEGPGGFIEAIVKMRNCKEDQYVGMTLQDVMNDYNIPAWKKSETFLRENPNVMLENGKDGTGNILSLQNFEHVVDKYSSKMDLITADGGFDFSMDFNQQEIFISRLLFAQIAFALCMQKKNGTFILKIFDCFMQHTVDLLYMLSSFYSKVYIIKPKTTRYANSEKYIVCHDFLFENHWDFYPYLHNCFENMMDKKNKNKNVLRFLKINTSYYFLQKIEEYNAIFGQKQIQNIHYTLSLIENKHKQDKLDTLIKTNIQKSTDWCMKYNVSYNPLMNSSNIFLNSSSNSFNVFQQTTE